MHSFACRFLMATSQLPSCCSALLSRRTGGRTYRANDDAPAEVPPIVTFNDSRANADAAREALRGLAHATRSDINESGNTSGVSASLSAGLASLGQSLDAEISECSKLHLRWPDISLGGVQLEIDAATGERRQRYVSATSVPIVDVCHSSASPNIRVQAAPSASEAASRCR